MQSHDNTETDETVTKTVLILVAVAFNILELFIPRIPLLPWLKPGLANSITIIWIIRYGTVDALLFTFIRVWISSFYFGLSLVTITLALSGGVAATLAMGGIWALSRKVALFRSGTVGIAVTGALFHNAGQLVAVYLLLARNSTVIYQLPAMGIASLVFGCFTGLLTPVLWKMFIVEDPMNISPITPRFPLRKASLNRLFIVIITACGLVAALLLAVDSPIILASAAAAATISALFISSRGAASLIHPLRFWFLFLFIAVFNLFFSYGTRIASLPVITHEGCLETAVQSLRLWTWIELSLILQALHANTLFYNTLRRIFPNRAGSLAAALFALEYFPDVIAFVKSPAGRTGIVWRRPLPALHAFADRVKRYIIDLLEKTSDENGREQND